MTCIFLPAYFTLLCVPPPLACCGQPGAPTFKATTYGCMSNTRRTGIVTVMSQQSARRGCSHSPIVAAQAARAREEQGVGRQPRRHMDMDGSSSSTRLRVTDEECVHSRGAGKRGTSSESPAVGPQSPRLAKKSRPERVDNSTTS